MGESIFGNILTIDVKILGAEIAKQQLDEIRIAVYTLGRSVTEVSKQFMGLTQQQIMGWQRTLRSLKNYNMESLRAKELIDSDRRALKLMFGEIDSGVKKTLPRFNMQALSFLFAGMAMKRFSEGFFRFTFNKWEQYEGYQSAATDATMRLTASWEFLRFSIFNALGQSELFQSLIGALIDAFNWISRFVGQHPELTAFIAELAGIGVILGSISMAGSIIYQIWQSVTWLKEFYALKYTGSVLDTGLGALSLMLWGTAGGKGAIVQKIQKAIKYLKNWYKIKYTGTLLDIGLTAISVVLGTIITQLQKAAKLIKEIGIIGIAEKLISKITPFAGSALTAAGTSSMGLAAGATVGTGLVTNQLQQKRAEGESLDQTVIRVFEDFFHKMFNTVLRVEVTNTGNGGSSVY